MSKNAEGWIRHRGGKCPVDAYEVVVPKFKSGDIGEPREAGIIVWSHTGELDDVMRYRLHKPAEQVEACSKPELQIKLPENYGEIMDRAEDGPLQWRDRINEIDATTQALTTERADLVQNLASEGFALIGRINELLTDAAQKHEDMSDWRNWKVGDELVAGGNCGGFSFHGEIVKIIGITISGSMRVARSNDPDCGWLFTPSEIESDLSFHSRPSA